MQRILKKVEGDKVIWMVTILLSILSILAVYSAISTLAYKAEGNSLKFLVKHTAMLVLGFGVMVSVHKLRFKYFSKAALLLLWVSAALLLLTLLMGPDINHARRWLRIPFTGLTFQSSDLAKIVLITFTSRQLNQYRTQLHDFREGVWPVLWPSVLICGLILPADFSTAAMLFAVSVLLMFIGGVPIKHLLRIAGMGVAGILLIFSVGKLAPNLFPRLDTWTSRLESFASPGGQGDYQTNYAQVAIYNGGLLPKGPGTGLSRNYLPHPYSDMIYAFIIEEYGAILGGLGVLLLYLILLYRCIKIAVRTPKHFGGLLVLGLSFLLVSQAFVNMAVAVRLFPTTGQPLPLLSMGGTSVVFTCLSIAMILSVSRSVFNPESFEASDHETLENDEPKNAYVNA
jgi:cell division protein FtsW